MVSPSKLSVLISGKGSSSGTVVGASVGSSAGVVVGSVDESILFLTPNEIQCALLDSGSPWPSIAIGQPDAHAGEIPCAYVELIGGASATNADLIAYAEEHVAERAAVPKHVEILDELPKTAVGKVFKPDLRKMAISRVYGEALKEAGIDARIKVIEDKTRGLVARIVPKSAGADEAKISATLGGFARPWEMGLDDS